MSFQNSKMVLTRNDNEIYLGGNFKKDDALEFG